MTLEKLKGGSKVWRNQMTALLTVYCNNINCSIWTYLVITYTEKKEKREKEQDIEKIEWKKKEGGAEVL